MALRFPLHTYTGYSIKCEPMFVYTETDQSDNCLDMKAIWGEIRVLSFVHSPIQTSWFDLCSYEVTGGDCYFPAISCEITKIFAYVAYVCYICIIIFHLHRVSITFLILYPKSQVSISNTTRDIFMNSE